MTCVCIAMTVAGLNSKHVLVRRTRLRLSRRHQFRHQ
ncbi:hypothetical protein WN51_12915 [Melipona quadrifasciata]|uniref:Uncharacterized protein n=1 Tax=Melipona quadrifasciata TaxID=166423 RepID=A0A0N0U7J0_9HYME|nr:hypothetical protein WN51_12915 [Melipona quadrifasciata]